MADEEKVNVDGQTEDEKKLDCTVNIEDSGPWKKKITVEIPRAEIDRELNEQYDEFMKVAEVPGFRKGRAPRRLVEKRFGEDIGNQSKLRLLAQAFEQIEEGQDLEILGEPDFDPENIELPEEGDLKFDYEVEVKPQFEIPSLEGIKIEKPMIEVNDERINETIQQMLQRFGRTEEVTDGAAEADDLVLADVTLKVEGIDEPETEEAVPVRVGRTAVLGVLVEDMDKTLTGAKLDDEKTLSVTISDNHRKEEYRGKKGDFTLKVKEIRRQIPAELNEELFKQLGVDDEAELRSRIEEQLESEQEREQRNAMRSQVYEHLDKEITFDLPEGVASRFAARVLQRQYYDLLSQGIPMERIQENQEQLQASSSERANRELKMNFVMESVAEKLEVEVSEAEVNGFVANVAASYGRRPEKVREEMAREGRLDTLRSQLRDEKAIDKILEMAEVVDAPADKKEKAPKKKTAKKTAKKSPARQPPRKDDDEAKTDK